MITLGLVLVIIGIFLAVHYGLAYLLASPELKAIQGPLMPKIVPTPPPLNLHIWVMLIDMKLFTIH